MSDDRLQALLDGLAAEVTDVHIETAGLTVRSKRPTRFLVVAAAACAAAAVSAIVVVARVQSQPSASTGPTIVAQRASPPATFFASYDGGVAELSSDGRLLRIVHRALPDCMDEFWFVSPDTMFVTTHRIDGVTDTTCTQQTLVNVVSGKSRPASADDQVHFDARGKWSVVWRTDVNASARFVVRHATDTPREWVSPQGMRVDSVAIDSQGRIVLSASKSLADDTHLLVIPPGKEAADAVTLPTTPCGDDAHWIEVAGSPERIGVWCRPNGSSWTSIAQLDAATGHIDWRSDPMPAMGSLRWSSDGGAFLVTDAQIEAGSTQAPPQLLWVSPGGSQIVNGWQAGVTRCQKDVPTSCSPRVVLWPQA